MPAGALGREADDIAGRPRAPRRLLVRVALTEGLGRISTRVPLVLDVCELPSWLEAELHCAEPVVLVEQPGDGVLLKGEEPQAAVGSRLCQAQEV